MYMYSTTSRKVQNLESDLCGSEVGRKATQVQLVRRAGEREQPAGAAR